MPISREGGLAVNPYWPDTGAWKPVPAFMDLPGRRPAMGISAALKAPFGGGLVGIIKLVIQAAEMS